ncbi:MAG: hypothetical protein U9Q67_01550 [Patescibacteria group bacterium]|nr:hypothetical protein [Patescibacteria group bacterium]
MKKVKPDLLQFFKDLHPIFIKDYKIINDQTLEVQTNLPNLWKNINFLQPIEDFSTDIESFENAQKKMLEIANIMVKSMSTIPILHAAHEMGYETTQLFMNRGINTASKLLNRYYSIGIGKEACVTVSAASSGDAYLSQKTQKDKWLTNTFIQGIDLPIAKWALVKSKDQLDSLAQEIGLPLVMKPVGLTGGHAVFVGLKTVQELKETYDKIHKYFDEMERPKAEWQKKIIVQALVHGDDYRVLVINGKVEIATHRIPARVIGDGKNTVRKLIEIENRNPQRNVMLPTHTLKQIVIDDELEKVVKEQELSLDSVPGKDKIVQVRKVASMSQGGITADVTDKIHPQIQLICESIASTIHANVLGVDVLCENISKPLTPDNGCIIEMNTMPETYLNTYPVIGKQYPDAGKKILAGLLKPKVHTNRVVAIGNIDSEVLEEQINQHLESPGKIGGYYDGKIMINRYEINSNLSTESAVLSLKKNRSLDTILLHYKDTDEVEKNGVGFNEIDLLVVAAPSLAMLKAKIDLYKSKKLIRQVVTI